MATMLEAKPFVLGMHMQEVEKRPFSIFQADPFCLVISGVGKANAAMAAAYCCKKYHPACVINLGAAGASGMLHHLGDIFHVNKIIEPDRVDVPAGKTPVYEPHVIKGFKTATLATSDKPVITSEQRKEISGIADLMDMEGAAVAQACALFDTRCLLFKFISDTPEHVEDGHIVKNIRRYRTPFYTFFENSIRSVLHETQFSA